MDNRYIIKTNNEKLIYFYYRKSNIFIREMINDTISSENIAAENVRENYTVTLCKNGEIYLFCQSVSGDIIQFKLKNGEQSKNIILKNSGKISKNILFYCIENGSQMSLIYNIPITSAGYKDSYDIMKQVFDGKGSWKTPEKIDTIVGMSDFIFKAYSISNGYGVLFYQKNNGNGENSIGYREFNIDSVGQFNPIYLTNYRIVANSFLASDKGIHFIFAVKNIFSTRIIYRKKGTIGVQDYIVLSESKQVESCELSIIKNKLYAFWKNTMGIFYCISEDNGNSFSRPYKYTGKTSGNLKKAVYLSFPKMTEENFFVQGLYTDNNNICDIKIIPELCDNFIPKINASQSIQNSVPIQNSASVQKSASVQNSESEQKILTAPNNQDKTASSFSNNDKIYSPSNTAIVEMLKNQVNMLNNQLNFKDKQIEQLTASLQRKNEEIILNDRVWREKYKKAIQENNTANTLRVNNTDTKKIISGKNISENINSENITTENINSENITTKNINSENITTENTEKISIESQETSTDKTNLFNNL